MVIPWELSLIMVLNIVMLSTEMTTVIITIHISSTIIITTLLNQILENILCARPEEGIHFRILRNNSYHLRYWRRINLIDVKVICKIFHIDQPNTKTNITMLTASSTDTHLMTTLRQTIVKECTRRKALPWRKLNLVFVVSWT